MKFWNIATDDATGAGIVNIDGEIVTEADWWSDGKVVARRFRQALDKCKDVTVQINSPGGDVMAGAEMYSALMDHKQKGRVTVNVTGLAASAASVVAMAGDEILMSPVAYMMIHNPWSICAGNASELERTATRLREIG